MGVNIQLIVVVVYIHLILPEIAKYLITSKCKITLSVLIITLPHATGPSCRIIKVYLQQ